MGVPGLWTALERLAERRSFTEFITSDALNRARNGMRPPVIGVDASSLNEWLQAPGEAEAELACLNRSGYIDYVFTPDCDAFLFGAKKVIRSPQLEENRDIVQFYDADALRQHEPQALSPTGLRFVAVLSGGDYCMEGLQGCGLVTAVTLAKYTDLPSKLDAVVDGVGPTMSEWRQQLCYELANNPQLRYKQKLLASRVPDTFPDAEVIQLYRNPKIACAPSLLPDLAIKYPDSGELARLGCQLLQWRWVRISELLQSSVWPGHCMRQIIQEKAAGMVVPPGYSIRTAGLGLQAMRFVCKYDRHHKQPGSSASFQYCGLEMWISAVQTDALSAYIKEMNCDADSGAATRISALLWLPASILNFACPDAIRLYKVEHPQEFPGSNSNSASSSSRKKNLQATEAQNVIDLTVDDVPICYSVTEEPGKPPTIDISDD
ncbi:hypothetical protein MD484_g8831, partial [Candolleomyces efflorescens]